MFNLKQAKKEVVIIPMEKMLIKENKEMGLKPAEDSGNLDYLLKDNRKEPDGQEICEKLLEKVRCAKEDVKILEGTLNDAKKAINDMDHRAKTIAKPLMDYSKDAENKLEEDFVKASEKNRDTDFWDKFVGDQLLGEDKKIIVNRQPSQLLSNFKTREDFNKENPSIDKKASVELLKDADSMLFYLYKTAATENRELNTAEKQIADDINSGKIRLLAQMNEIEADEELAFEKSTIEADEMEEKEKTKREIYETLKKMDEEKKV